MGDLFGAVNNYDGRPTQSQLERMRVLLSELEAAESRFATLTTGRELTAINSQLEGRGAEPLAVQSREQWDAEQESGAASATLSSSTVASAKQLALLLASGATLPLGF
jgi:hypothetical protein